MTIDKKNHKSASSNNQAQAKKTQKNNVSLSSKPSGEQLNVLPIKQVKRRFFVLLALAFILIAVLIWLTLAVLEANDIEPFGEIATLVCLVNLV